MKPKEKNPTKIADKWGCKYLITVNQPTITALLMVVNSNDLPPFVAYKSAIEVGSSGNLHKHIYVVFARSVRLSTLLNKYKHVGAQVDLITQGTEQTVIGYVGDTEKEKKKECRVLTEYTTEYGDLQTSQGQRNDISATDAVLWQVKDAIDAGATKREIYASFFPYMIRYGSGLSAYLDFVESEKAANKTNYIVNKTQERFERESMERWTESKTEILLDMDVFNSN